MPAPQPSQSAQSAGTVLNGAELIVLVPWWFMSARAEPELPALVVAAGKAGGGTPPQLAAGANWVAEWVATGAPKL